MIKLQRKTQYSGQVVINEDTRNQGDQEDEDT